uniref:7TM_GPCR_Srx domain-containing protein n=1 Tax=Panagrellus redivivus TaxID=6233 RepID=A0A7E4W7I8_PANRE
MWDDFFAKFIYTVDKDEPPIIAAYFFRNKTIELWVMFVVNLILGMFLNYVIFTQSSSLGSFKYYLFNQTFFAQILELTACVASPVFMGPFMGGYVGGLFRNVISTELTYLVAFVSLILFVHMLFGLFFSLFNRFVFIFQPKLKKLMHNKITLGCVAMLHFILDAYLIWLYDNAYMTHDETDFAIHYETGNVLDTWVVEKSIVYMGQHGGRKNFYCLVALCCGVVLFFGLVGIIIWFIAHVFMLKKTSVTLSSHSTYLLTTVLVQTGAFLVFLFGPSLFVLSCWTLAIPGSTTAVNVAATIIFFHEIIDILCTLYFVKPYREYCLSKISRYIPARISAKTSIVHSITVQVQSASERSH